MQANIAHPSILLRYLSSDLPALRQVASKHPNPHPKIFQGRHSPFILSMPTLSNISKAVTQQMPRYTLYEMMRSSHDFQDVKLALNDHTNWSIELVSTSLRRVYFHVSSSLEPLYSFVAVSRRSQLFPPWTSGLTMFCSVHLTNSSHFFMLSTLSFLVMAETIHIHYGRLSPAELKVSTRSFSRELLTNKTQERVESMGCITFAILFAVPDIGFIIVRVTGLVALSGTPGLATTLVLISMLPPVILPLLACAAKLMKRGRRASDGGDQIESGIVDDKMPN